MHRHASAESLRVLDHAARDLVTVRTGDDLEAAHRLMTEHRVSAVIVVGRDGSAAGVLSRRDLLQVARVTAWASGRPTALELPARGVGDVMSHPARTVPATASVADAARVMVRHGIHRVILVDGGRPVGVFSTRDAVRAVQALRTPTPLGAFAAAEVVALPIDARLSQALIALDKARSAGVLVTEDDLPVGVFGEAEALAARGLPPEAPIEELLDHALVMLPAATPLFRAAAYLAATGARRALVFDPASTAPHHIAGAVAPMDLVRALAA